MIANLREPSFGGRPQWPMSSQTVSSGSRAESRIRLEASALPRRTIHERPTPIRDAYEPDEGRDPPVVEREPREQAPRRRAEREQEARDHEGRDADLPRAHDLAESLGVEARRPEELELARVGRRLHLARPVEVAHVRRHVLDVRDDDVAGDELDQPPDDDPGRPEPRGRLRAVEAVAAEALERLDRAPVVDVEPVGSREHLRPGELGEHLALARRLHVELVEERRDRVVVPGKEPQALERVVERLEGTRVVVE